jgi:hypothetical protein
MMLGALMVAATLGAAPPPSDVQPTVMMRRGDPAPWAGWLVDGERLQAALMSESDLLRCRDTSRIEKTECAADAELATANLAACDTQVAELIEAGRGRLTPPVTEWYEHPAFVATVAVAASVAVTSGIFWMATR